MSIHYDGQSNLQLLRHGEGEYRYPNTAFRFKGGWKNGSKDGQGVFEVAGISTYKGDFKRGEIEGKGVKIWKDGRKYSGDFRRGEAYGQGRFTSPTGESFNGTWEKNKRHGRGELTLPDGHGKYVGEFKRHRYHGDGRLVLASGFRYLGRFCDGVPHGFGTASYPLGSTYNGPFESGLRSGVGGKYICGVTGICYNGSWYEGRVERPSSKWLIELDDTGSDTKNSNVPGGAKADNGVKGARLKTKDTQRVEDNGDVFDEPAIAHFNQDGDVVPFLCRCARTACIHSKMPAVADDEVLLDKVRGTHPPELDKLVNTSSSIITRNPWITQSEESGRTLSVTLHQVSESPEEHIGSLVPFFVRRPNATDVSERLGRFTTNGLVALFELDKRCHPRKGSCERLTILSETETSPSRINEVKSKLPASTKLSTKNKGRGREQLPNHVDVEAALEARWESIRNTLDSNRCLVLEARKGLCLKAAGIFESGEFLEGRKSSTINNTDHVEITHGGLLRPSKGKTGVIPEDFGEVGRHQVGQSSPFTICLDFHLLLDLHKAPFVSDDSEEVTGSNQGSIKVKPEKIIIILTCSSKNLEISAMVQPSAHPKRYVTDVDDIEPGISACYTEKNTGRGHQDSAVRSPTDILRTSAIKEVSTVTDLDDSGNSTSSAAWYVSAIYVRSGSCTALVPCTNPTANQGQRKEPETERGETMQSDKINVELAAWHSLTLAVSEVDEIPVLHIDGAVFPLRRCQRRPANADPDEAKLNSDAVVIGGANEALSTLAVKNLAVYRKALDNDQLAAITCVYSMWRRDQEAAAQADAGEKKDLEDDRETEVSQWPAGVDQATSLRRRTVRGEAKINNIVLPKTVIKGGNWVLRLEDVSHGETSRPESGDTTASSATEEERAVFPSLAGETIKLEPW